MHIGYKYKKLNPHLHNDKPSPYQCETSIYFCVGINQISDQVYAYIFMGSFLFEKPRPPPTQPFLKINTYPHLIISDFKISSIHNQLLPKENNNAGCFSKTRINNHFIPELCYLDIESKKNPLGSFSCYK
jgi:hypothetical protein